MNSLGDVVRKARASRLWSQAELASHAGVSRKYVSEIELGKVNVSVDVLRRIVNVLDLREIDIGGAKVFAAEDLPVVPEIVARVNVATSELNAIRALLSKSRASPSSRFEHARSDVLSLFDRLEALPDAKRDAAAEAFLATIERLLSYEQWPQPESGSAASTAPTADVFAAAATIGTSNDQPRSDAGVVSKKRRRSR